MADKKVQRDEATRVRERSRTRRPKRWKVVIHNDDYTTMEFVILVLVKYFRKSTAEATQVMLEVHHKGRGVAGVYTRDVAESKVAQVIEEAQASGHPLQLSAEPE